MNRVPAAAVRISRHELAQGRNLLRLATEEQGLDFDMTWVQGVWSIHNWRVSRPL
jgi:hypothetical protein